MINILEIIKHTKEIGIEGMEKILDIVEKANEREKEAEIAAYKELRSVQKKLRIKKNRKNDYGGFFYRNLEDIFSEFNKIETDACITVDDEIFRIDAEESVENKSTDKMGKVKVEKIENKIRVYVKSVAKFYYKGATIKAYSSAREQLAKTKMDAPQITGAASSYAAKYAVVNLLGLGDGREDADSINKGPSEEDEIKKIKDIIDNQKDITKGQKEKIKKYIYEQKVIPDGEQAKLVTYLDNATKKDNKADDTATAPLPKTNEAKKVEADAENINKEPSKEDKIKNLKNKIDNQKDITKDQQEKMKKYIFNQKDFSAGEQAHLIEYLGKAMEAKTIIPQKVEVEVKNINKEKTNNHEKNNPEEEKKVNR